jgi:hypothetical protein
MFPVLLAMLAPSFVLVLAIFWDRRQRKQTEKPPQSEKLLRPPGYSLSARLDKTFDSFLKPKRAAVVEAATGKSGE